MSVLAPDQLRVRDDASSMWVGTRWCELQELIHRTVESNFSLVEDDDPVVRIAEIANIVAGHDDCRSFVERLYEFVEPTPLERVEAGGGFVK
jgi:hypothetical protein